MDSIESLKARIKELEKLLGQSDRRYDIAFQISRSQSRLLGLFCSVPLVTNEMIEERLEIATDARVAVHRLRQSLARHGVKILTHAGTGYSMPADMKAKVTSIVNGLGVSPEDLPDVIVAPSFTHVE